MIQPIWKNIPGMYSHVAGDADGEVYAYRNEPVMIEKDGIFFQNDPGSVLERRNAGSVMKLDKGFHYHGEAGNVDWKYSLVSRQIGE